MWQGTEGTKYEGMTGEQLAQELLKRDKASAKPLTVAAAGKKALAKALKDKSSSRDVVCVSWEQIHSR